MIGDVKDTVPALYGKLGGKGRFLLNTDLGTFDASLNPVIAAMVSQIVPPLMVPGGIIMHRPRARPAGL